LIEANPIPAELDPFLSITTFVREYAANSIIGRPSSVVRMPNSEAGDSSCIISDSATVNDFEILKVLGKGSFGKVYLVRQLGVSVDEVFAMKVLSKDAVEKRNQVHYIFTTIFYFNLTPSNFRLG